MVPSNMWVETFAAGPLGCNCSIVADLETKQAVVIDPGGDFERIAGSLHQRGLTLQAIVHTHTHIDHVGATAPLQSLTGARASIHEADRFLYDMLPVQAAMLGITEPPRAIMDGDLADGRVIGCGAFEVAVLHTPGHTPGSVCFLIEHASQSLLFSGDTLFRRGIGRTDLWGGDTAQIMKSLKERLLTLADDVCVVAGHGPNSTIGDERRSNPYIR
jgi:hydroxyacylglutathione hydrolase